MKKYVCKHLDDKYKQATHHPEIPGFENMIDDFAIDHEEEDDWMSTEPSTKQQMRALVERNPAVGTIIDKLGLIADDDEEAPF